LTKESLIGRGDGKPRTAASRFVRDVKNPDADAQNVEIDVNHLVRDAKSLAIDVNYVDWVAIYVGNDVTSAE
jgi:hypothetical protein